MVLLPALKTLIVLILFHSTLAGHGGHKVLFKTSDLSSRKQFLYKEQQKILQQKCTNTSKSLGLSRSISDKAESILSRRRDLQSKINKKILDSIDKTYDSRIRPHLGAKSEECLYANCVDTIYTDIDVLSFGPISAKTLDFKMNIFFRSRWHDPRLNFSNINEIDKKDIEYDILQHNILTHAYLRKNGRFLSHNEKEDLQLNNINMRLDHKSYKRFWTPDTYFKNELKSYLHDITYPNLLIRIRSSGWVLMSNRLTVEGRCTSQNQGGRNFPFDVHTCKLTFGSFNYNSNDVIYNWTTPIIKTHFQDVCQEMPEDRKKDAKDLRGYVDTSRYTYFDKAYFLADIKTATHSSNNSASFGMKSEMSELTICFLINRNMTYYVFQAFLPTAIIVIISQISFWINKESTPARMIFGTSAVLSLIIQSTSLQKEFPTLNNVTALDVYLSAAYTFCFGAALEYALVNYHTISTPRKIVEIVKKMKRNHQAGISDLSGLANNQLIKNIGFQNNEVDSTRFSLMKVFKRKASLNLDSRFSMNSAFTSIANATLNLDPDETNDQLFNDITKIVKEHNRGFFNLGFGLSNSESENEKNQKSKHNTQLLSEVTKAAMKFAPEVYDKACKDTHAKNSKCQFDEMKRMLSQKALEQMTGDSYIDRIARVAFPISFLIFNFGYGYYYLRERAKAIGLREGDCP